MWDVAIVGAGLAGITCARQLTAAGYSVCLLDKSRGLGGRIATRRMDSQQKVDHGLRYWQPATAGLQALTDELLAAGVIKPWAVRAYEILQRERLVPVEMEPVYVAEQGMSAIAKYLARDFTLEENLFTSYRAVAISAQKGYWRVEFDDGDAIKAKQCAIAIPAAQAAELLDTYTEDQRTAELSKAIAQLQAVTYWPCLSVLAGYESDKQGQMGALSPQGSADAEGWMVTDKIGTSTDWVGLDSSKRSPADSKSPVIVIHSKPAFAQQYINAGDLQPAASVLLRASARKFCEWMAQPDWFKIHRWPYARINQAYPAADLRVNESLVCGGDWCVPPGNEDSGLQNIDYAYQSGLAMAKRLQMK